MMIALSMNMNYSSKKCQIAGIYILQNAGTENYKHSINAKKNLD